MLKVLHFRKGNRICDLGEPVDMFGLVLFGSLRLGSQTKLTDQQTKRGLKIHYFKIGDMFGHQHLAEQREEFLKETW